MTDPDLPALHYAGTSGHSGTETSRERAEHLDSTGATRNVQNRILTMIYNAGERGLIWHEINRETNWGHSTISSALTNLHQDGHIAYLDAPDERRERCGPYVFPDFVNGRSTKEAGTTKVRAVLLAWLLRDDDGTCRADLDPHGFIAAVREAAGLHA